MKHYENRFHMTPEQSLFLAKKKWDENVYCGMPGGSCCQASVSR